MGREKSGYARSGAGWQAWWRLPRKMKSILNKEKDLECTNHPWQGSDELAQSSETLPPGR